MSSGKDKKKKKKKKKKDDLSYLKNAIIEKKKIRQNKTKPCVSELHLRSTQVYHAFLG